MAESPWIPARLPTPASVWWTNPTVTPTVPWITWLDGTGVEQAATLEGCWDGAVVRPGVTISYYDGTTERPVKFR